MHRIVLELHASEGGRAILLEVLGLGRNGTCGDELTVYLLAPICCQGER